MKEKDIKKLLKQECKTLIPDKKERLMTMVGATAPAKRKRSPWKVLVPALASCCLVLVITLSVLMPQFFGSGELIQTNSVVIIDVNPLFEINSDKSEKIISVRGLNKQAVTLLNGNESSYVGMTLDNGVDKVITLLVGGGYVRNEVRVAASCGNNDYEKHVEDQVATGVKTALKNNNVTASVTSQEVDASAKALATKHNITERKASLIQAILAKDSTAKLENLLTEDIDDLIEQLYDYDSVKMADFEAKLIANKDKITSKKGELLAKLDKTQTDMINLFNQIFAVAEVSPVNYAILNANLVALRDFYLEEIFDGVVDESNLEDFLDEITSLKEDLSESIVEAKEELDQSYAEWAQEYAEKLKDGVDGDDDFDFDDLIFDFDLDINIKLSGIAKI